MAETGEIAQQVQVDQVVEAPTASRRGMLIGSMAAVTVAAALGVGKFSARAEAAKPAWPGRVTLTFKSFGKWGPGTPEPALSEHPLLVVDDGRYNYPADPDPNTDTPTSLFQGPSEESKKEQAVRDGTVLKVVGYTEDGQRVYDNHRAAAPNGAAAKGSTIWLEVQVKPGSPKMWVPRVNTGWTSLKALKEAHVKKFD